MHDGILSQRMGGAMEDTLEHVSVHWKQGKYQQYEPWMASWDGYQFRITSLRISHTLLPPNAMASV